MTSVEVDASDVLRDLAQIRLLVTSEVATATFKAGAFAVTTVRALASTGTHPPGRAHIDGTGPGPNVATGDYRRSINSHNERGLTEAVSEVSTNAVQANRLEYGFIGRDSAGRMYRQRPYPHWAPAEAVFTPIVDGFFDDAADAIEEALRG